MTTPSDTWAVATVIRIKKTGQFALNVEAVLLNESELGFLYYLAKIGGKGEGNYYLH